MWPRYPWALSAWWSFLEAHFLLNLYYKSLFLLYSYLPLAPTTILVVLIFPGTHFSVGSGFSPTPKIWAWWSSHSPGKSSSPRFSLGILLSVWKAWLWKGSPCPGHSLKVQDHVFNSQFWMSIWTSQKLFKVNLVNIELIFPLFYLNPDFFTGDGSWSWQTMNLSYVFHLLHPSLSNY